MNPITRERKRRKWSQDTLAEKANLSQGLISRIENDKVDPTLSTLRSLAAAMEIEVSDMLRPTTDEDRAELEALAAQARAESLASVSAAPPSEIERLADSVTAFGLAPGCDVWQVRDRSMQLAGYMPGDRVLVMQIGAEGEGQLSAGDAVIAQVISRDSGEATTVFRRYEPPFLLPASMSADDRPSLQTDAHIRGRVVAAWRLPADAA